MEAKEDKILDQFTNTMVKSAGLEKPSLDFTAQIMEQVGALEASKAIVYEPLISKRAWFVIALAVCGTVGYVFFTGSEFAMLDTAINDYINQATTWELPKLNFQFDVSNVMVYSFLIMAGFVVIEIPLLRRMMKF